MMSNCTDVIVHYKVLDIFFFGTYVLALMLLCILYWVLRCNRTFFVGMMLLCPCVLALMLLCIMCRTVDIGTDVIIPMSSCTDITVQYIY